MNLKTKGWLFVVGQFLLFGLIVYVPFGQDWENPLQVGGLSYVAFALSAIALFQLGKSLTPTPVPKEDGHLVTNGLYNYVRHPIYGLLIIGFGLIAITSQNFISLGLWMALVFWFNLKAKFEEQLLALKYPEYLKYAESRGKFFPKINLLRK